MASTLSYWRVVFYPVKGAQISSLNIAKLELLSSSGAVLHGTPTLTAGKQHDALGYPLANILDGLTTSYAVLAWEADDYEPGWIAFQLEAPQTVDRIRIRFNGNATVYGTRLASTSVGLAVQHSWGGSDWVLSASVGAAVVADNTDYVLPAARDSLAANWVYVYPDAGIGGIYGSVTEDSVAANGYPVVALDRVNFNKVAYTTTDEYGGYTLQGLNPDKEYLVLAVDPTGPAQKNALVLDRVKPISALRTVNPDDRFLAARLRDPGFGAGVAFSDVLPGVGGQAIFYGGLVGYMGDALRLEVDQSYRAAQLPSQPFTGYEMSGAVLPTGLAMLERWDLEDGGVGNGSYFYLGGGLHPSCPLDLSGEYTDYADNRGAQTLEFIVRIPAVTEPGGLVIRLGGIGNESAYRTRSLAAITNNLPWHIYFGGTNNALNLRIQPTQLDLYARLGSATTGAATSRGSAALTPNSIAHIVVVFLQDQYIKVYIDSVLAITALTPAAGRLFQSSVSSSDSATNEGAVFSLLNDTDWGNVGGGVSVPNPNYATNVSPTSTALNMLEVRCYNYGISGSRISTNFQPFAGGIAYYGQFFGARDQAGVDALYASYQNPTTHQVLPTQSGYMGEVEADNPTYYYLLSDASYPAFGVRPVIGRKDSPLYPAAGTAGIPTFNVPVSFAAGLPAMSFASGSKLAATGATGVNTVCTIEFFMQQDARTEWSTVMEWAYRSSGYSSPSVRVSASGSMELRVRDPRSVSTQLYTFPNFIADLGTPYHIAITYDPHVTGEAKLYVNGELKSSLNAAMYNGSSCTTLFAIGASPHANTNAFFGKIGHVAIYGRVLSAARIAVHYAARLL
jgi:hypothetical protein